MTINQNVESRVHPGNVLFTGPDGNPRVSGVVDWVETSWGPADLDVAHCSTALAVLHGVPAGMRFADLYLAADGQLAKDPAAHLSGGCWPHWCTRPMSTGSLSPWPHWAARNSQRKS
ncbi:phosphotransferase [Streptomyces sp. NBC_01320]|uniref:phosphotransferase n=1 Tax=Streptomyces sp. NBC_01320 TaxID=2903824 RepID=UPI003FA3B284